MMQNLALVIAHWRFSFRHCGSPSGQWHEEVRPWSDAVTTRRPSLAWRAWAHQVQSVYDHAPMPGRHCSTVSGGTLVTSLWDHITTASSFGCQPSTDSAATSADHIWRSGVCCCWSVDVELTAETSTAIPLLVLLSLAVFWKHSSSQSTSVSSALEALTMTRYINLRFTLHLTLHCEVIGLLLYMTRQDTVSLF